jgi:hypothetical protein
LLDTEDLMTVVNNCTNCHAAKLVVQNKMSVESWNTTIKWMQEAQNQWKSKDNCKLFRNQLPSYHKRKTNRFNKY